jgi:hypothetical protein
MNAVVDHIAGDDQLEIGDVQDGGVAAVDGADLDDRQVVAFIGNASSSIPRISRELHRALLFPILGFCAIAFMAVQTAGFNNSVSSISTVIVVALAVSITLWFIPHRTFVILFENSFGLVLPIIAVFLGEVSIHPIEPDRVSWTSSGLPAPGYPVTGRKGDATDALGPVSLSGVASRWDIRAGGCAVPGEPRGAVSADLLRWAPR